MKFPLVSIIIPSYNYGLFISQTLDCLLSQSYQNWEAIIVDDGSTDETQQVVNVYLEKDPRFIYIHQSNQGPSVARNTGLKNAKGIYLAFLDADDLLSKDKITRQVGYMEQHPDCDISYTSYYHFKDEEPNELFRDFSLTEKIKEVMPKIQARGEAVLPCLVRSSLTTVNTPLLRRDFLLRHHLYFDESYKSFEDRDFMLRCAYADASFAYLDDVLAYALIRVHRKSASQNRATMSEYEIKLRRAIKAYLEQNPGLKYLEKMNNKYLYRMLYRGVLWKDNSISYSGIRHIIKEIGWVNAVRFIIKELNRARREKLKF